MIALTADYVTCRNVLGLKHWRREKNGVVCCNALIPLSMLPTPCPLCGAVVTG